MKNSRVISQIETLGYSLIPAVYSLERIRRALDLVLAWDKKVKDHNPADPPLAKMGKMIWNLQCKDPFFLFLLLRQPDIESVLRHFLNDPWYRPIPSDKPNYLMRSCLARTSSDALPLHIDSFVPYGGNTVICMQFMIALEDTTVDNGVTVVVPGSHLSGDYATQSSLEDAVPIEAKAGDVVLWDSRIWHGTTANTSGMSRWVIIGTFTRWWIKQLFAIPSILPPKIFTMLSDEERAILGYCSQPLLDEVNGVDMRKGYEVIRPA